MARLFFCGDIINQFCNKQFVSDSLQKILSDCDYAVGNLEGVLSKDENNILGMMQHPSTLDNLKKAGFDHLLLANNHITDYGKDALLYTQKKIIETGLSCSGAAVDYSHAYEAHYFEINEEEFAIIDVSEAQGGEFKDANQEYGHAWIGATCIDSLIQETRAKVDRLFICVHAGLEHYQLPLRQYRELFRHYCDLGADCVIASHPHIVQGMEVYKNSFIFYSLGNFYFPRTPDADYKSDIENNAFSVIISTEKDTMKYEVINHRIENHEVTTSRYTESTNIRILSDALKDGYGLSLNKQNKEAFEKVLYNLFRISLNGIDYNDSWGKKVRAAIKLLFFKETNPEKEKRMMLLFHIMNNETYRYLLDSVIENKLYQ